MEVLLLGHNGMLGNAVNKYFLSFDQIEVKTLLSRWPSEEFKNQVLTFEGEYIINCIAAIPQKYDQFNVNYDLPCWLEENLRLRIIYPNTDFEGLDSDYGQSKEDAFNFIKNNGRNTKMIKTSIIGHGNVKNPKAGLLDWFLGSQKEVLGYENVFWNGITTLEWAKQCLKLINSWDSYEKNTIFSTKPVSKYTLLKLFKKVYKKEIKVNADKGKERNLCVDGDFQLKDIELQLIELKEFYEDNQSTKL